MHDDRVAVVVLCSMAAVVLALGFLVGHIIGRDTERIAWRRAYCETNGGSFVASPSGAVCYRKGEDIRMPSSARHYSRHPMFHASDDTLVK